MRCVKHGMKFCETLGEQLFNKKLPNLFYLVSWSIAGTVDFDSKTVFRVK